MHAFQHIRLQEKHIERRGQKKKGEKRVQRTMFRMQHSLADICRQLKYDFYPKGIWQILLLPNCKRDGSKYL